MFFLLKICHKNIFLKTIFYWTMPHPLLLHTQKWPNIFFPKKVSANLCSFNVDRYIDRYIVPKHIPKHVMVDGKIVTKFLFKTFFFNPSLAFFFPSKRHKEGQNKLFFFILLIAKFFLATHFLVKTVDGIRHMTETLKSWDPHHPPPIFPTPIG